MPDAEPAPTRRTFLTAALATAAATAGIATGQRTHTVEMTGDLTFEPATVTIAAGETVVWDNVSEVGHTVTAYADRIPAAADYFASGDFGSEQAARDAYPDGDIAAGASYEYTFEIPGTYEYFCVPHESVGMTGTVEVEPRDEPSTPGRARAVLPKSPITGAVLTGLAVVAGIVTVIKVFGEDVE